MCLPKLLDLFSSSSYFLKKTHRHCLLETRDTPHSTCPKPNSLSLPFGTLLFRILPFRDGAPRYPHQKPGSRARLLFFFILHPGGPSRSLLGQGGTQPRASWVFDLPSYATAGAHTSGSRGCQGLGRVCRRLHQPGLLRVFGSGRRPARW